VWGLVAALGSVGLLVRFALTEKSDDPVLRPALQRGRLARILKASRRRRLTRTEAEDGLVLCRRLGEDELARWFDGEVREAKKRSSSRVLEARDGARRL
jgi:hypothetical protein